MKPQHLPREAARSAAYARALAALVALVKSSGRAVLGAKDPALAALHVTLYAVQRAAQMALAGEHAELVLGWNGPMPSAKGEARPSGMGGGMSLDVLGGRGLFTKEERAALDAAECAVLERLSAAREARAGRGGRPSGAPRGAPATAARRPRSRAPRRVVALKGAR